MQTEASTQENHGREWLSVRRCLAIVNRLLISPANGRELILAVLEEVGVAAYASDASARRRALKRDLASLRGSLDVKIQYDPVNRVYCLVDRGPLAQLWLSPASLQVLRMLSNMFDDPQAEPNDFRRFIEEITAHLPAQLRCDLEQGEPLLEVDVLQSIETGHITQRVWFTLQKAIRERRKLGFEYRSPRHADGQARYHEVAPYRLRFQWGHWYLYACDLLRRGPDGVAASNEYRNFRLAYIADNECLKVLPGKLPAGQRKPRVNDVHYVLAPEIARGSISRHFDQMEITRMPDGSAEVHAKTDNTWEAVRILLGYGETCVVLGGEVIRREMERCVRKMAENYGLQNNASSFAAQSLNIPTDVK